MKLPASILLLFAFLLAPAVRGEASLKASLNSSYLVKGEQAVLTLYLRSDERPTVRPGIPVADHITIQFQQEGVRVDQNRQRVYVFSYAVRSFQPGTHLIPPFSVEVGGKLIESQPLPLQIAELDELSWHSQSSVGPTFRYASAVFVPSAAPYDGQTFAAEVKVYLPDSTGGASSGVAELNHDGLVAWRFEAVPSTTRVQLPTGGHTGITFKSTAAPIRSGAISLGPGKARIMMRVRRSERGFTIIRDMPGEFQLPERTLQARPLPPGAPEGFNGAVGSFVLSTTAETDELEQGDPIAVRLNVTGNGNLDSLPAPRLDAPAEDWKVYEPSRLERQGERRDVTGTVSFSQIIRPLNLQDQVPAFELVYFNPASATYASTRSQPIPFQAKPSARGIGGASIIPTLATPVEDMQGILAVVDPLRGGGTGGGLGLLRYWQVIPALLAVALLVRLVQRFVLPRFRTSERERQIQQALEGVAGAGDLETSFLRAAGAFVERWIPSGQRDADLSEILRRRDTDCFRPERAGEQIGAEEKKSILRTLRERALSTLPAVLLFGLATVFFTPTVTAADSGSFQTAETAYLEGNYRTALELYSSQPEPHSADLLYNIGNCHYQLEQPGLAALFYHRALLLDPRHREAGQNLRFIQRTEGSLSILRKPYEQTLAILPEAAYRQTAIAGGWITALSILALFAFAGSGGRILASFTLAGGALLTAAGISCDILYPDDAEFAPPTERLVMTNAEMITGQTEASESGQKVIDIPPGSLARLLADRGNWRYVEFPNETRAWVPTKATALLEEPPAGREERL